ncbi:MAG: hypothetical protein Q4D07_03425 [Selenomonadaceae bacterium]|nr:hypothetical protein [Selenomonadaceae bacterium]
MKLKKDLYELYKKSVSHRYSTVKEAIDAAIKVNHKVDNMPTAFERVGNLLSVWEKNGKYTTVKFREREAAYMLEWEEVVSDMTISAVIRDGVEIIYNGNNVEFMYEGKPYPQPRLCNRMVNGIPEMG